METTAVRISQPSPTFRALVLLTTAATYALVVLGGVVRTTDSGDACPDWPRCHGELLPPLDANVLIEFSHRLSASVVGLLVLATAIVAWRTHRDAPAIVWGATLAVGLVGVQIVLGGITVLSELDSTMVTAHLATASALLATLVALALLSMPVRLISDPDRRTSTASFRNVAVVVALATLGLMLTGSYVAGSGASLAFRDWPLFDGRLWPEGGRLAMAHATHRFVAGAVGVIVVYLAVHAWRTQRWNRPVVAGSLLAVTIYVAQVFVGAANIWTLLQPSAAAAHLALAAALWSTLMAVAFVAHLNVQPGLWSARGPATEPSPAQTRGSGVEAAPGALSGGGS